MTCVLLAKVLQGWQLTHVIELAYVYILTDYNTSATPRRDSAEVLRKFCNLFVTLYSSTLLHFYAFKKRKYFYAEVKGSEPKSKLLVMSYHETFIYVCKS